MPTAKEVLESGEQLNDSRISGHAMYRYMGFIYTISPDNRRIEEAFSLEDHISGNTKKYIGLILDERNDSFEVGWEIDNDLAGMLAWKEDMLSCTNVDDCKILEVREVKTNG